MGKCMQMLDICIFGSAMSLKVGSMREFFGFQTELWNLFPFTHS